MAEVSWIRITTTLFDDEKVKIIEAMPEGDTILIIWIKLLALCGRCNSAGYIMLTEDIAYTEEMLATIMSRPLPSVQLALKTFESFGMIGRDEDGIYIANWEKHQNIEGLERIKEQNRVRKQRQRDREKQSHVTVTGQSQPNHATDKEEDIDKELIVLTAEEQEFLEILQGIKNYPLDRAKDRELYQTLTERYPDLDILDVAKDWAAYKMDKPLGKKSNPRSQLNTACKKSQEWGKNLKKPRGDPKTYTHERTDLADLQKVIQRKTLRED